MKTLSTLMLGATGGTAAWLINIPLPWMLGPLILIMVLAICGVQTRINRLGNRFFLGVLGFWLGSRFEPAVFQQVVDWYPSVLIMTLSVILIILVNTLLFRWLAKLDLITSIFASLPGNLNAVIIMGEQLGGDGRWIAIAQTLRITLVIISTTVIFFLMPEYDLSGPAIDSQQSQSLLYLPLVPLAWWASRWIRLPMPEFLGPLLASAILASLGFNTDLPGWVMVITFIVLGSYIGGRFYGTRIKQLLQVSFYAVLATLLAMLIAAGFALMTYWLLDIPFSHAFLALVPGGIGEMALIAASADIDPLYIVFMHIIRMFLLMFATPAIGRYLSTRVPRQSER
ncbi:AbrB family transcriptional regulator [Nitrincola alkalilacustris]|uniref:AbrB family transcriptional regulator n=1 Tax=Nitrincola alkalilacustris TaxID=1571224 RepID=UPI00124DF3DF|nr:AbrB family transcriptional regulator [Nitrincola alkalilacustris]